MIICVDGPAASGKSTIAKLIANQLGFVYIDTGAMYRAVALCSKNNNISLNDLIALEKMLSEMFLEFKILDGERRLFLNGEDVSEAIRTPEISKLSSAIATIKIVRQKMVDAQRKLGERDNVILDGRDIGTVVFPNADYKFFLTASLDERAKRRLKELQEKGINSDFEQVRTEMKWRDSNDSNRMESPLVKAGDAIEIDTTELTIEETVNMILRMINK